VFLLLQGQLWVVLRPDADCWRIGPCFSLLLATPWYALAGPSPWHWPFWVVFFGFSIWSVTLRAVRPRGLVTSICLGAAAAAALSFYWPLAVARLGYWRLGLGGGKQPSSQLAPFCLVWFLVVCCLSRRPTKLLCYILPWCLQERWLISLYWISLGAGHAKALGP